MGSSAGGRGGVPSRDMSAMRAMARSGSISGLAMSPFSTAAHMPSSKWLRMMNFCASHFLGSYLRSVAFVLCEELLADLVELELESAR